LARKKASMTGCRSCSRGERADAGPGTSAMVVRALEEGVRQEFWEEGGVE
jgi:hypothetical protein